MLLPLPIFQRIVILIAILDTSITFLLHIFLMKESTIYYVIHGSLLIPSAFHEILLDADFNRNGLKNFPGLCTLGFLMVHFVFIVLFLVVKVAIMLPSYNICIAYL